MNENPTPPFANWNPPRVEHLPVNTPERYALLEPYWRALPLNLFAIHLQGVRGQAWRVRYEYPGYTPEAERAQAIFDQRTRDESKS